MSEATREQAASTLNYLKKFPKFSKITGADYIEDDASNDRLGLREASKAATLFAPSLTQLPFILIVKAFFLFALPLPIPHYSVIKGLVCYLRIPFPFTLYPSSNGLVFFYLPSIHIISNSTNPPVPSEEEKRKGRMEAVRAT